jgi:hypothetical protein
VTDAPGDPDIIDIRRDREIIASCPACQMERRLPEGWQDLLRQGMDPADAAAWDGQLRCLNTPACDVDGGTVMTTRLVTGGQSD